jgi:hypothetical protein
MVRNAIGDAWSARDHDRGVDDGAGKKMGKLRILGLEMGLSTPDEKMTIK